MVVHELDVPLPQVHRKVQLGIVGKLVKQIERFNVRGGQARGICESWGNADNQGPESSHPDPPVAFSWLHGIDAVNDALYASDRDLRRIVKVRLDYREVKGAK